MGRLSKQVFGEVTGAVGHVVFKHRAGDNYIAMRAEKQKICTDPVVLARRAKFALAGKIAKAINSLALLKSAWPQVVDKKLSQFNEIFQANYDLIGSVANVGSITVAPVLGFTLTNPHVTNLVDGVQIQTDALGVGIGVDTDIEKYLVAAGVVLLQSPTVEGLPQTLIIPFKTTQQNLDLINPVNLTVQLMGTELFEYESYTTKRAFTCLITLNDNGQLVKASRSVHS
jgi:hypothetical protein